MGAARTKLTYANVMSTLAMLLALSGGIAWAAGKIGEDDIKRNAVHSRHIAEGGLRVGDFGPDSVRAAAIAANAVEADALAPNSVGPASLQGNAVGSDQLAPDSVGTRELKPGGIEREDISPAAASPRLFAHVSSSGVLGEQAGVESAGRISKGQYFVRFNRELRGCVAVATVGFGFGPGVIGAGGTAQARMNLDNDPSKVGVTVYRKGYTFNDVEDNDFHLIVAC